MFSEDIDFFNSYARYNLKKEVENKKNVNTLIHETKDLLKLLEQENLSENTKIKINNILSVLKLI